MSEHLAIDGWRVYPAHHSAFVRTFNASPETDIDIDYNTSERRKGHWVDAIYTARVVGVYIAHRWDDDESAAPIAAPLVQLTAPRTVITVIEEQA